MNTVEKKRMIQKALNSGKSVYIHGKGATGNGMRIDPDGKIYLSKYYKDEGMYWKNVSIDDLHDLGEMDWRRRVEVL